MLKVIEIPKWSMLGAHIPFHSWSPVPEGRSGPTVGGVRRKLPWKCVKVISFKFACLESEWEQYGITFLHFSFRLELWCSRYKEHARSSQILLTNFLYDLFAARRKKDQINQCSSRGKQRWELQVKSEKQPIGGMILWWSVFCHWQRSP